MKHHLALAAFAMLLAHCHTGVDSEFATLETRVLTDPAPNSFVGMWYRKDPGGAMRNATTATYLFKSDGTGMSRFKMGRHFRETEFTWKYDGQGQWTLTWAANGPTSTSKVHTTGTNLLLYSPMGIKLVLVKSE